MTNQERLLSFLGFAPPANSMEGAMLDKGIDGSQPYDPSNSRTLKICAIEIMELLLTTANTTDTTPGFAALYDRNAVLNRIKLLKAELGLVDESMPTISNGTYWW